MFQHFLTMGAKGLLAIWVFGALIFVAIRASHYIFKPADKVQTLCSSFFIELPGLLVWPLMLMSGMGRSLFADIFFRKPAKDPHEGADMGFHMMTPQELQDDVVDENHELHELFKTAMENGGAFGERQKDGKIKVTPVKTKKGKK